jgi:hypothetical protein
VSPGSPGKPRRVSTGSAPRARIAPPFQLFCRKPFDHAVPVMAAEPIKIGFSSRDTGGGGASGAGSSR